MISLQQNSNKFLHCDVIWRNVENSTPDIFPTEIDKAEFRSSFPNIREISLQKEED